MDLEKLDKFLKKEDNKVAWLALVSGGKPIHHHDWYTAITLQIFDGYLISRVVRGSDDNIYEVDFILKVVLLENLFIKLLPLKLIHVLKQKESFQICTSEVSSLKSTIVANNILKSLNVATNKKWSGVKVFGIDRADVKLILKNELHNLGKKRKDLNDEISIFKLVGFG